mmetsp:Transcript_9617/g.23315  ORF Transcript_9617/g.23315 Transcript_9617/m.23315 type:complete len:227 (+) Transcript_9617:642-1322(+)
MTDATNPAKGATNEANVARTIPSVRLRSFSPGPTRGPAASEAARPTQAAPRVDNAAPKNPSQVLLGEMEGNSGCFPRNFPKTYAIMSLMATKAAGAKIHFIPYSSRVPIQKEDGKMTRAALRSDTAVCRMYSRKSAFPLFLCWNPRTDVTTPAVTVIPKATASNFIRIHGYTLGPFQAITAVANHQYFRSVAPSCPQSFPPIVSVISRYIITCKTTTKIDRPSSLK